MSGFKLEITYNFNIPKLSDASIPLEQIAKKIVTDSRRNIRRQKSPFGMGGSFTPLAKDTIRKKRKAKYSFPQDALYATGMMFRNIRVFRLGKNRYSVGVAAVGSPKRDVLALLHQEIGTPSKRGMITRPFVGISPKTRTFAQDRMNRWIKKQLEAAPPKYIKIRTGTIT